MTIPESVSKDLMNTVRSHLLARSEAAHAVLSWCGEEPYTVGGFFTALLDALSKADIGNTARIELGFPHLVRAFRMWRNGDVDALKREASRA